MIFGFGKKNKADVCPMTDMHLHILPGIDDGSKSMEMSLNMVNRAYEEGIRSMVATPHYHPGKCVLTKAEIMPTFESFKDEAKKLHPDIRFALGREVLYLSDTSDKILAGENLQMADSSCMLLEYEFSCDYRTIQKSVSEIKSAGFKPIIAHVERFGCLLEDWERILELKRAGCLIQINASDIIGDSREMRTFIKDILIEEAVDFVSTDAHRDHGRSPKMMEAAQYLYKKCDRTYVNKILSDNAELFFS